MSPKAVKSQLRRHLSKAAPELGLHYYFYYDLGIESVKCAYFRDRIRTTSSVLSDMICVIVTEKICERELQSKAMTGDEDSLDLTFEEKGMANGKEEMFPLNDAAV